MRTKLFSWMLVCGLAVFLTASAHAAQDRIAGRILAAKVRGTVTALHKADNVSRELHDNDAVSEGYVVSTGPKSSVVLLFANGSAVNLGADSSLSIDEFLLDPFDAKYSAANATEEPSTSVTSLSLARGELVANVKHLHRENGSTYTVKTPVGAAGIRGTTFRIVFHTDATGNLSYALGTAEGIVAVTGANGTERSVPGGKEVHATFDVAPGTTTIVPGSLKFEGVGDISAETQAAIAEAIAEILAAEGGDFDSGAAPGAIVPPSNTTPGDGQSPTHG